MKVMFGWWFVDNNKPKNYVSDKINWKNSYDYFTKIKYFYLKFWNFLKNCSSFWKQIFNNC